MSFETKYVAPRHVLSVVLRRLAAVCRADREYPTDRVHSVYFDDLAGAAYDEVRNGDYYKSKVRVRWYGDEPGTNAVLECKQKIGSRRRKLRLPIELDPGRALEHASWLSIPHRLASAGIDFGPGALQPTLHLSYRRHRFIEPHSGLRIAIDHDLRVRRAHRRLGPLPSAARHPYELLVVETKGNGRALPDSLQFLLQCGLRRRSISKYGVSLAMFDAAPTR